MDPMMTNDRAWKSLLLRNSLNGRPSKVTVNNVATITRPIQFKNDAAVRLHSCRNAAVGSISVARRAGTNTAASALANNTPTAAAIDTGSLVTPLK